MKQQRQKDCVFKTRFKKRHRKDLTVEEVEDIIEATKQPYRLHNDVAKEFRVSHQLVSRLYQESLKGSKKIEDQIEREELDNRKRLAVEDAVTSFLFINKPIVRAQQIKQSVLSTTGLEVEERLVREIMRKDLHMGYRMAKAMPPTCNSVQNLVLRQQYALRMLALLQSGRRIINVDQSWLN